VDALDMPRVGVPDQLEPVPVAICEKMLLVDGINIYDKVV
jgi:hypothetical protein